MEQIILKHITAPKKVSKFIVRETVVKEKEMTFNQLTKTSSGVDAFLDYRQNMYNDTGNDLLEAKNMKLCVKSQKDIKSCLLSKIQKYEYN